MTTLNTNEQNVIRAIGKGCYDEYCADIEQIATDTNLTINQVKGYIGVLTQKGLVETLDAKEHELACDGFALMEDDELLPNSYARDTMGEEEYNTNLEAYIAKN